MLQRRPCDEWTSITSKSDSPDARVKVKRTTHVPRSRIQQAPLRFLRHRVCGLGCLAARGMLRHCCSIRHTHRQSRAGAGASWCSERYWLVWNDAQKSESAVPSFVAYMRCEMLQLAATCRPVLLSRRLPSFPLRHTRGGEKPQRRTKRAIIQNPPPHTRRTDPRLRIRRKIVETKSEIPEDSDEVVNLQFVEHDHGRPVSRLSKGPGRATPRFRSESAGSCSTSAGRVGVRISVRVSGSIH